ncbi:MAG: hypothetical protein P1U64_06405 [Alcanivoracaceae bacterium]|nr:hypothetical protein [Alcanivoracaceae bacterium]
MADAYGLELMTASNKGFDALSPCGKQVEIKATQSKSAAFRSKPEHAIVIQIAPDGSFAEIFNGPGSVVWEQFDGKPLPSNGQYQISMNQLKKLNEEIPSDQKIHRVA